MPIYPAWPVLKTKCEESQQNGKVSFDNFKQTTSRTLEFQKSNFSIHVFKLKIYRIFTGLGGGWVDLYASCRRDTCLCNLQRFRCQRERSRVLHGMTNLNLYYLSETSYLIILPIKLSGMSWGKKSLLSCHKLKATEILWVVYHFWDWCPFVTVTGLFRLT